MQSLRIAIATLIATAIPAHASPEDALEYVKDAIVAVDETGGRCKREAFDQLLEIRNLLRDESDSRAALVIQRTRRVVDSCPASVDRSLRRAGEELRSERRRVRERNEEHREVQPEAPKRPLDLPFTDYGAWCLEHWLAVEIARPHLDINDLTSFVGMTVAACTSPESLDTTSYYPNGKTGRMSGGTWFYPNGRTARTSTGTYFYPNGKTARSSSGTWFYSNGKTAFNAGNWFYPTGKLAGTYETVIGWARQHVTREQDAAYVHGMQSDVDAHRIVISLRLLQQVR